MTKTMRQLEADILGMENTNQSSPLGPVGQVVPEFSKRKLGFKKIVWIVVAVAVAGSVLGYFLLKNKTPKTAEKVYRVGILNGYDFFAPTIDGFKAKMTELGYVEGKNVFYDVQKSDVDLEKYDVVLNKFIADKVDLILAFPTEASIEAKKLTKGTGIPVVFANANVEGVGLINSISAPGDNITGVRFPGPDIAVKRLEIMLEIFPNAKRIVMPYFKDYPNVPPQLEAMHKILVKMPDVKLIELPVASPPELQAGLDSIYKSGKIDALLFIPEPVSAIPDFAKVFGKFAFDHHIPVGGTLLLKKYGYEYETLFGVLVDSPAVGNQAAVLADKIFKGIPPGTIPVVSAETYFEINYKYAQEFGVTISEALLSRADKVYR